VRSQKRYPRRTVTIRPERQYQALQAARQREATDAFRAEYARRAGIEGMISRGTRSARLRRIRYIGLARVHLGHILTVAGLNMGAEHDSWKILAHRWLRTLGEPHTPQEPYQTSSLGRKHGPVTSSVMDRSLVSTPRSCGSSARVLRFPRSNPG
jgi:hypothetical protein